MGRFGRWFSVVLNSSRRERWGYSKGLQLIRELCKHHLWNRHYSPPLSSPLLAFLVYPSMHLITQHQQPAVEANWLKPLPKYLNTLVFKLSEFVDLWLALKIRLTYGNKHWVLFFQVFKKWIVLHLPGCKNIYLKKYVSNFTRKS